MQCGAKMCIRDSNIPFLFELDPAVDTRKLSDAIARMVSAHSYLLTQVYLDDNGEMVPVSYTHLWFFFP